MAARKAKSEIKAIKGFDKDLTCRGHQFEIGEKYTVKGKIKACENGFHSCPADDDTPPHAVFEYYAPGTSRYCEVTASGKTDRDGNKIASASVTIGVELTMGELMRRVAKWCVKAAKGKASNTGYCGAASNTGYHGAASNTGYCGAASNTGDYGAASNTGYCGAASNTGYCGAASNTGDYGAASNTGYCGAASNTGYCGAASNTGTRGAASNTGTRGAASNTGDYGAASNTGYCGAALSHAYKGRVMAEGDGQALYCSELDGNWKLVSVACGITGQNGIKAGVWYTAKDGALVEHGA